MDDIRREKRRRFLISQRKRARRMLSDMPADHYIARKSMQARLRQIERGIRANSADAASKA